VYQGPPGAAADSLAFAGLRFRHPLDIDESWTRMRCTECHIGDASIYLKNVDLTQIREEQRSGHAASD
jgi:hypothetical protein